MYNIQINVCNTSTVHKCTNTVYNICLYNRYPHNVQLLNRKFIIG